MDFYRHIQKEDPEIFDALAGERAASGRAGAHSVGELRLAGGEGGDGVVTDE